jgi:hypothetical protein
MDGKKLSLREGPACCLSSWDSSAPDGMPPKSYAQECADVTEGINSEDVPDAKKKGGKGGLTNSRN